MVYREKFRDVMSTLISGKIPKTASGFLEWEKKSF